MGEVYLLAAGTVVNVVNWGNPSEDKIIVQHNNGYSLALRAPPGALATGAGGDPVTTDTVLA